MSTDYHRFFRHCAPDLNLDLDLNPNPNPKDWEIKIRIKIDQETATRKGLRLVWTDAL